MKIPKVKAEQVIIVKGHPECLLRDRDSKSLTITHPETGTFKIGKTKSEVYQLLEKVPNIKIESKTLKSKALLDKRKLKTHPILKNVIDLRRTKTSTLITIGTKDEDSLKSEVNNIENWLYSQGIELNSISERCHWSCSDSNISVKPIIENEMNKLIEEKKKEIEERPSGNIEIHIPNPQPQPNIEQALKDIKINKLELPTTELTPKHTSEKLDNTKKNNEIKDCNECYLQNSNQCNFCFNKSRFMKNMSEKAKKIKQLAIKMGI